MEIRRIRFVKDLLIFHKNIFPQSSFLVQVLINQAPDISQISNLNGDGRVCAFINEVH